MGSVPEVAVALAHVPVFVPKCMVCIRSMCTSSGLTGCATSSRGVEAAEVVLSADAVFAASASALNDLLPRQEEESSANKEGTGNSNSCEEDAFGGQDLIRCHTTRSCGGAGR
eukprot:CAMPEP_0178490114 /NCGR_PEP_ID=MMETSP0696-20121128/10724_1 /TAXON_ID=265572 /ORGANISM="Extubocellulus spinifer, Strain CCMP396" /LENGTH=112 /DNA_ID=CAMNT_0020117935 /DNA_START=92 /DNA_END=428 /DNA_ORIENTATION=+